MLLWRYARHLVGLARGACYIYYCCRRVQLFTCSTCTLYSPINTRLRPVLRKHDCSETWAETKNRIHRVTTPRATCTQRIVVNNFFLCGLRTQLFFFTSNQMTRKYTTFYFIFLSDSTTRKQAVLSSFIANNNQYAMILSVVNNRRTWQVQ